MTCEQWLPIAPELSVPRFMIHFTDTPLFLTKAGTQFLLWLIKETIQPATLLIY